MQIAGRVIKSATSTSLFGAGETGAGKLHPQQEKQFWTWIRDDSFLLKLVTTKRYAGTKWVADRMLFDNRLVEPKIELTAPRTYHSPTFGKIEMTPKRWITAHLFSREFFEENLEGYSAGAKIMRHFAIMLRQELELMALESEPTGPIATRNFLQLEGGVGTNYAVDDGFALTKGWLQRIEEQGNIIDAGGAPLGVDLFRQIRQTLPRLHRNGARLFGSEDLTVRWRELVSGRATAAGDAALTGTGTMTVLGMPFEYIPLLQNHPRRVDVRTFTGAGSTINLRSTRLAPDAPVILVDNDDVIAGSAVPYVEGVDFTVNRDTGVITHLNAGDIEPDAEVRVQYQVRPILIYGNPRELLLGWSRQIIHNGEFDAKLDGWFESIHGAFDTQLTIGDAFVMVENLGEDI